MWRPHTKLIDVGDDPDSRVYSLSYLERTNPSPEIRGRANISRSTTRSATSRSGRFSPSRVSSMAAASRNAGLRSILDGHPRSNEGSPVVAPATANSVSFAMRGGSSSGVYILPGAKASSDRSTGGGRCSESRITASTRCMGRPSTDGRTKDSRANPWAVATAKTSEAASASRPRDIAGGAWASPDAPYR